MYGISKQTNKRQSSTNENWGTTILALVLVIQWKLAFNIEKDREDIIKVKGIRAF